MSISPGSPETSRIGEHYDRAALSDAVIAVTGVMDFLRLQRRRRFPPARHNEDLAPLSALKPRGTRYPGSRRRIEQSAARSPPTSRTDYRLMQRAINDRGPLLESLVNHLSRGSTSLLANLAIEPRTLTTGQPLP